MPSPRQYTLNKNSTKKCAKCGEFKNVAEFGWANKKRGWKQSYCRQCAKRNVAAYYQKRKQPITDYLKSSSCVDCGNDDYRVLEFDHVRGEKLFNIASNWARPWNEIEAEIKKCEIRCRNCHIIRHHEDGWATNEGPPVTNEDYLIYLGHTDDEAIVNSTTCMESWHQKKMF